mmetsp:Transcript_10144/g.20634  ORF Transcript_10144/g.20634 Transcript_10144/m.20634 type:complete len:118 (+) Transcript_10144:488-841(+)
MKWRRRALTVVLLTVFTSPLLRVHSRTGLPARAAIKSSEVGCAFYGTSASSPAEMICCVLGVHCLAAVTWPEAAQKSCPTASGHVIRKAHPISLCGLSVRPAHVIGWVHVLRLHTLI